MTKSLALALCVTVLRSAEVVIMLGLIGRLQHGPKKMKGWQVPLSRFSLKAGKAMEHGVLGIYCRPRAAVSVGDA